MGISVIQAIPDGFTEAVEHLNQFPQDLFAELCHNVTAFLQYTKGPVSSAQFVGKLHAADVCISQQAVQASINALTFLFRSAARARVTSDGLLKELKQSLIWSDSNINVIKHVWTVQGPSFNSPELASQLLNIGQLVDIQWKLGVAMTSDICRSLNSTFVIMSIKVADPAGEVTVRSFEMTVAEFKNFSKKMRDMAAMLETA